MAAASKAGPWAKAVFSAARHDGKPLLVSSFQGRLLAKPTAQVFASPEVAEKLPAFERVQIDAQRHRAVDRALMSFLRVRSAQMGAADGGGWPLHVVLSPETFAPFMAAGFLDAAQTAQFLGASRSAWEEHREECEKVGRDIADLLDAAAAPKMAGVTNESSPQASTDVPTLEDCALQWDSLSKNTPRFILGSALTKFGPEKRADALATLARSGMIDHVNGGVFSFALSADWHLPSFEKRMEDQATLLLAVVAQLKHANSPELRQLAANLVTALRAFVVGNPLPNKHVWTYYEFQRALSGLSLIERDVAQLYWGVNEHGNVNDEYDELRPLIGDVFGKNVLTRFKTEQEVAEVFGMDAKGVQQVVERSLAMLQEFVASSEQEVEEDAFEAAFTASELQSNRGLALSALSRAAPFVPAAQHVAHHLANELMTLPDPRAAEVCADTAFAVAGLLDYAEVSPIADEVLESCLAWHELQVQLFKADVGYFYGRASTASTEIEGKPMLFWRPRFWEDGTEPNYNAVTASNLARMAKLATQESTMREQTEDYKKKMQEKTSGYAAEAEAILAEGQVRAKLSPLAFASYLTK